MPILLRGTGAELCFLTTVSVILSTRRTLSLPATQCENTPLDYLTPFCASASVEGKARQIHGQYPARPFVMTRLSGSRE